MSNPEAPDNAPRRGCQIEHDDLRLSDLPAADAPFYELEGFGLTYDGYLGGERSVEECAAVANRVTLDTLADASFDELRTYLFFQQRSARWASAWSDGPTESPLSRAVVEEIRWRLTK